MQLWNSNAKWPWPYDDDTRKYLDVPDYWLVGHEEVSGYLRALQKGQLDCIGQSAGARPMIVVYYGPARPERKICVAGGTHAIETEGIASVINVINVLEAGQDLRGQKWPTLQRLVRRVGFYLMPFFNPDAAARNPVKSYVGMDYDAAERLEVGFWKNGKKLCVKRVFAQWVEGHDVAGRLEHIGYLGLRFNDAGIDISRPSSARKTAAVETRQTLRFLKHNRIDCFMDMHSACGRPWLGICHPYQTSGEYGLLVKLRELTRRTTVKAGGPALEMGYKSQRTWTNGSFFAANLGIYSLTYEEHAGYKGQYPNNTPFETIWQANIANGMYTILGLAQALLRMPSPWEQ